MGSFFCQENETGAHSNQYDLLTKLLAKIVIYLHFKKMWVNSVDIFHQGRLQMAKCRKNTIFLHR